MTISQCRFIRCLPASLLLGLILSSGHAADAPAPQTLRIGALLSLTGNWSSLGLMSQTVLELAQHDVNRYLSSHGSNKRVEVLVRDTQLDPELALQQLRRLIHRQNVIAVIGPQSSSEVSRLKDLADRERVPLLSQGSTASSLSLAGDSVYRLVPDDSHESEAMAALMQQRGVQVVIPAWRADAGNDGLQQSLQARLTAAHAEMLPGVRYSTDREDFGDVAQQLKKQLDQALRTHQASAVAIYLAGFDEVAALFHAAEAHPVLRRVKWYGSDGVALSGALQADDVAAAFAMAVDYPNPTLGLPDAAQAKWQALSDRVFAQTGQRPDAFALAAYDALWLVALNAGYQADIQQHTSKDILAQTAAEHFGATGWTVFNRAGDRQRGDYDFWALRRAADGSAQWVSVCRYDTSSSAEGALRCTED
ncbi:MAG: ABC transporter substrate-binding protein [Methylococcaceae bacterium]|nr:MAG: ABC transporter substrate-binding protein [Methylococcaceae bacterium]